MTIDNNNSLEISGLLLSQFTNHDSRCISTTHGYNIKKFRNEKDFIAFDVFVCTNNCLWPKCKKN